MRLVAPDQKHGVNIDLTDKKLVQSYFVISIFFSVGLPCRNALNVFFLFFTRWTQAPSGVP